MSIRLRFPSPLSLPLFFLIQYTLYHLLASSLTIYIPLLISTPSGPYLNPYLALFLWSIIKYRGIPF